MVKYTYMNYKFFDRPFLVPALALGISLIIGLWILGVNIANHGSDNVIVVTGSTIADVTSDIASWQIDIRRTAYQGTTEAAYAQVARDATVVTTYLQNQNLASSSVSQSVISTDDNYSQTQNAPTTYTVHESVTISTSDVNAIDKLSRELGSLSSRVAADTLIVPQQPAYYISTLPELRVSLVGKAIEDARARAVEIAKSGSTSVGPLKGASTGVVQVLAPNSTEVEDYGSYDTSTIAKQVMVTARATFYVK